MPKSNRPDDDEVHNGPGAPAPSPGIPRCPRCGHPDFEVVNDEWGRLILVCESCGYRAPSNDPRFAAPPR